MSEPDLFPPIKPDHAEAIGYVAAHWSLVEQQLGFLLYSLLDLHTIPGWAVTAEVGTLQRIATLGALLNLSGNREWIHAWSDLAKTMDDLRNLRNDAVHSAWQVVGPTHFRLRVKAKGRVTIKQGPFSTVELQRLSKEIRALVLKFSEFMYVILSGGAGKIINQLHPPGWPSATQAQSPSQKSPAGNRNPKRERQQRSRKQRRAPDASNP